MSCRGRLWERGGRGKEATVPAGRYRPTLEHSVKRGLVVFLTSLIVVGPSAAQPAPPAVGVVRTERQQITQIDEFIGRIQAVNRVAIVARVTAFLEKRLFVEGSEVKQGDLLYLLEQPPFQAQVDASKAAVEQLEAQHRNAQISLNRAQELLRSAR
jgi:membrane fusion protein (multidrug efflux system)